MKLKRYEFSTTFAMLALFVVTAAFQLMSAYGAVCIAWDPGYARPPFTMLFAYAFDNLLLFRISNIITWLGTLVWGYVIFAMLTQKKGAYLIALITSAVSFVFGLIPAIIADTKNFTVPFSVGSPHWGRTFANLMVLILLLIPPVRTSLQNFTAAENRWTGKVAQQLMVMSLFVFWLSLVSFLGTTFMAGAHVVDGVNIWEIVQIQTYGSYITLAAGVSMLGGGFILKQFNPSKALITTVEVTK
ncbi:MAG: hypothetical protein ACTSWW_11300 [Promethearchaeota archaeon]